MKENMDIAYATLVSVLTDIKGEVDELAKIYDSRDLFGICYGKFADLVNGIIDEYIEK